MLNGIKKKSMFVFTAAKISQQKSELGGEMDDKLNKVTH